MESELSVRDVLTSEYVGVSESDTVQGAVSLMRAEQTGCVLVVRGSDPVGIMTEWDVLGLVENGGDPAETTVGEIMTAPVITVEPTQSVPDAATIMARESIRNLVVDSNDEVLGLVTQRDIIAAAGSFQPTTQSRTRTQSDNTAASGLSEQEPADERLAAMPLTGTDREPQDQIQPNGGDEYSTQGVCETCGSLADELWDSNGQLVCSDCRSV
ncbi:signal transduction protein with CBS domains [Natrialba chahannaoensis JCM 10990]|uniref:Signal transduction protein with CBS domains n=1 Tax=Natrialba chahannaoensis JCM 10990 TaxID=1227492 RepID=M0AMI1_9EURY|nr:CBS domain-containing protein [Natrialba chahannaoensis]ELY99764.1 signal transduction protein with CBS domains [Natrialba chahannaoensis JCM 10990]